MNRTNGVRGEIQEQLRVALADTREGWWVIAALDAFAFLETNFGYRLKEIYQHFRGNHIIYAGATYDLVIGYDPQDTGRLYLELWVREDQSLGVQHPRAFRVGDLLRARVSHMPLPDEQRQQLSQLAVIEALQTWATALKILAPDVLRGDWPEDVMPFHLW